MKPLLLLMLKFTKVIKMKVVEETYTEAGGVEYTVQYEGIEFILNESELIIVLSELAVRHFEAMINNLIS